MKTIYFYNGNVVKIFDKDKIRNVFDILEDFEYFNKDFMIISQGILYDGEFVQNIYIIPTTRTARGLK